MTSRWGPLGWMTLHSISANYPENPTPADILILNRFLDSFRETITCPSCKSHFTSMFATYKSIYPDWANSKFNLFLAVCRMHNTVNKRLDKPLQQSLDECMSTLKNATKNTSPAQYRISYLNYLMSNWAPQQTGDGLIAIGHVRQLIKINNEYWVPRETQYSDLNFNKNANVLELVPINPKLYEVSKGIPNFMSQPKNLGFRIIGGKLKLGGK